MKESPTIARPQRRHKSRPERPDLLRACMLVAVGLLAACAAREPMLNSERIASTFGSYGIEVLEATGSHRTANLYSETNGQRTMRTYAQVRFILPIDEAVRAEHELIVAGGSIGQVFKSRGWTVSKHDLRVGAHWLQPSDGNIAALMRIDTPAQVAVHEYALVVSRNGRRIEYAVITEWHHPDYLEEADLEAIYGRPTENAK